MFHQEPTALPIDFIRYLKVYLPFIKLGNNSENQSYEFVVFT